MEWLNTNVASRDAALEQTPEVLKAVCMDLPVNVFLGMVDNLVGIFLCESVIGFERIGVESGTRFYMVPNFSLQGGTLAVGDYRSADLPSTLQSSEHNSFVLSASTSNAPFALIEVHVPRLAADKGFVYLNVTAQLAERFILQGQTDAMQHEPSGFLSYVQIAGKFATADSVFAIREQPQ